MKVLLVEDDGRSRRRSRRALRRENFAVDHRRRRRGRPSPWRHRSLRCGGARSRAAEDAGRRGAAGLAQQRAPIAGADPHRARRLDREGRRLQGRRRRLSDQAVSDRGVDHAAAGAGAARGRPCGAERHVRTALAGRTDRRVRVERIAAQAHRAGMARAAMPDPAQGRGGRPHRADGKSL